MCGIVGAVSERDVAFQLFESLKIIEYRGYDAANIVVLDTNKAIHRHEIFGKVQELFSVLSENSLTGTTGIGNTHWMGKNINPKNPPPHFADDEIAIVRNGIVDNKEEIRQFLLKNGYDLPVETGIEVVGHLVHHFIKTGMDFLSAVQAAEKKLEGSFSLVFIRRSEPGRMIGLRHGSSLVIGVGENANYIASDNTALLPFVRKFIYLDDGDIADLRKDEIMIYDQHNQNSKRLIYQAGVNQDLARKGKYSHFMLKEIFDQSDAVLTTLQGRLNGQQVIAESFGINAPEIFKRIQRVQIVADGSSYHAALAGRHWIEEIAGLPCQVNSSSDNQYRLKLVEPNTLFISISQSGETATTLSVLRIIKHLGYAATLTISNRPESSLVRESDLAFITGEGPEACLTSTKSFMAQLTALLLFAIALGQFHRL